MSGQSCYDLGLACANLSTTDDSDGNLVPRLSCRIWVAADVHNLDEARCMFMTAPIVRMNRLAHSWSNGRAAGRHSNGQPGSHSSKCLSVVMESSTPQNPTAKKNKKHTHT